MKKQTAVEWLEECIKIGLTYEQEVMFEGLFQQAKEMENNIAQEYAEFCVRCDRAGLKLIVFEDWKKELTFKSE